MDSAINLATYLSRIGVAGDVKANIRSLSKIQHAHRLSIPFENLDVRLGRGISVDDDAIFDKLVSRKRGGYCFEHNALLRNALREIGYIVRPLLARVWLFAVQTPPKTHTLNLVEIDGEFWIADAGFGSSYCPPMRLRDGEETSGRDELKHRLITDADHGWMLQIMIDGVYKNEFSFSLDQVADLDLAMSNHWTATAPLSRFLHSVIVNKSTDGGMVNLNNDILIITASPKNGINENREIKLRDERELQEALAEHFGIEISMDDAGALNAFE